MKSIDVGLASAITATTSSSIECLCLCVGFLKGNTGVAKTECEIYSGVEYYKG